MHKRNLMLVGMAVLAGFNAAPAAAQWSVDQGTAIVSPSDNNSNAELLALSCEKQVSLEIFARGGAVRPEGSDAQPDYFSSPARVRADVDGKAFAVVAEPTTAGIMLAGRGSGSHSVKPVDDGLIEALKNGAVLTVAIDAIADRNGPDGSPFETIVRFQLAGAKDAIDTALAACRGGA